MAINLHLYTEEWIKFGDTKSITCKLDDIIIKHPNKRGKKKKKIHRMQKYVDNYKIKIINVIYLSASLG